MKAAVIDSLGAGPRFADFAEPTVAGGETLVEVTAAGLHPIARMLASGEHYGSQDTLPMIPGIDGTGRSPDGTRVYFGGVRLPYGPMAQRATAPFVLPLPDGLDEVTAAAIINPGNGAWLALTRRAALQPGETVLVLGATGVSGRIAVALAARMGAGRVIAAGRNRAICQAAALGKEWTPRELRHSFVSMLSADGVAVEDISHLVGHSSTRTTERIYRQELRPVIRTGAERMQKIFGR